MNALIEKVLSTRIFDVGRLDGFKAHKWEGTNNICECADDGGDGCSE